MVTDGQMKGTYDGKLYDHWNEWRGRLCEKGEAKMAKENRTLKAGAV